MFEKPYYTCPIEAAYMAKNFGVKFIENNKRAAFEVEGIKIPFVFGKGGDTNKYIPIHKDSLSIFDPQKDDDGKDESGRPCFFSSRWIAWVHSGKGGGAEGFVPTGSVKILERNGKSFIMYNKGGM